MGNRPVLQYKYPENKNVHREGGGDHEKEKLDKKAETGANRASSKVELILKEMSLWGP